MYLYIDSLCSQLFGHYLVVKVDLMALALGMRIVRAIEGLTTHSRVNVQHFNRASSNVTSDHHHFMNHGGKRVGAVLLLAYIYIYIYSQLCIYLYTLNWTLLQIAFRSPIPIR